MLVLHAHKMLLELERSIQSQLYNTTQLQLYNTKHIIRSTHILLLGTPYYTVGH
jgi:hypothetical protein